MSPHIGRTGGVKFAWLMRLVTAVVAPASGNAAQMVGSAPHRVGASSSKTMVDYDAGLFDDQRIQRKGDAEPRFRFDGRLDVEFEHLHRRGPRGATDDVTRVLNEVRMEFTYRPDDGLEAFASVEIGRPFEREARGGWRGDERLELREAYLSFGDIVPDVEVRIGRQEFEDGREWLYDARLDGMRSAFERGGLRLEAAVGREGLVPVDLLNPRRSERTDNFLLRAEYEVTDDWDAAAYVLAQEDRTAADASPTFFGVQSEGTLFGPLSHQLTVRSVTRFAEPSYVGDGEKAGERHPFKRRLAFDEPRHQATRSRARQLLPSYRSIRCEGGGW